MEIIGLKEFRDTLPQVMKRVRNGARYTVYCRNKPAFSVSPVEETNEPLPDLESDPIYPVKALGRSNDGQAAKDHDKIIYGL